MIASFGMSLRYSLDQPKLADMVDQAIAAVLAKGLRTKDIAPEGAETVNTQQMGAAVLKEMQALAG